MNLQLPLRLSSGCGVSFRLKHCLALGLLVAISVLASGLATGAYVIAVRGMAPMGVSAPLNPVNGAQCEEFVRTAAEYQNQIGTWHQQCLDANKGCVNGGGECSCRACEGLHTARDKFSKDSRDEGAACFAAVTKTRQAIYRSVETPELARAVQDTLLSGANAVAMSQIRRKLAELFETESLSAADLSKSIRSAQSAARMVSGVQAARAACLRQVAIYSAADCEKQLILATNEFQKMATANNSVFVRSIQRQVFEALNQQNRKTLELLSSTLNEHATAGDVGGQTLGR